MSARAALSSRSSPSLLVASLLSLLSFPAFAQLSNKRLFLKNVCGFDACVSTPNASWPYHAKREKGRHLLHSGITAGCCGLLRPCPCSWLFASRVPNKTHPQSTTFAARTLSVGVRAPSIRPADLQNRCPCAQSSPRRTIWCGACPRDLFGGSSTSGRCARPSAMPPRKHPNRGAPSHRRPRTCQGKLLSCADIARHVPRWRVSSTPSSPCHINLWTIHGEFRRLLYISGQARGLLSGPERAARVSVSEKVKSKSRSDTPGRRGGGLSLMQWAAFALWRKTVPSSAPFSCQAGCSKASSTPDRVHVQSQGVYHAKRVRLDDFRAHPAYTTRTSEVERCGGGW